MIANNDRLVFEPITTRPRVTWPEGRAVAVWHAPNVEHYDFIPPGGVSPQGRVPAPDLQHYLHRDYGNRVGFWRMLRAVDEFRIPSTVSLSLTVLQEIPEIRDAMLERGWEVMSHGISNLRPIYDLPEAEERAFLELSNRLVEAHYGGARLKGMLGPKISGTDNTVDLLAEHGFSYHADWIHDEQPRPLRTRGGQRIVSMPYSYMVNDVPLVHAKHFTPDDFVAMAKAQITRLLEDAERDGQARVACVATHPFLVGQPGMVAALAEVFAFIRSDERLWPTTAGAIADHYLEHHYDEQLASAEALATRSNR